MAPDAKDFIPALPSSYMVPTFCSFRSLTPAWGFQECSFSIYPKLVCNLCDTLPLNISLTITAYISMLC